MKKILYVVAFVSSASIGAAACSSDLKQACEDFVETRDACEALTPPDPENLQKYTTDLCGNIDPECKAYYECAILAPCNEIKDHFRLDVGALNDQLAQDMGEDYIECKEPENKACTDADLRP